jgi:hypothetical protein
MVKDSHLTQWAQNQQTLRVLLEQNDPRAIELFLSQHAMMHARAVSLSPAWSFFEVALEGLTEDLYRRVPDSAEHSIAWCLYHLARCEDVTMNLLLAGQPQVLKQGHWQARLKIGIEHTGNEMSRSEIVDFSRAIDLAALTEYCVAVGQSTRAIVRDLKPEDFGQKMSPSRVQQVRSEGALLPAAEYILKYWSRRTRAGLLQMPPTRHCLVHLNEITKLKKIRA